MPIATYDNPSTCHRECWKDKELLCSYSMELFFMEKPIPPRHLFFGANMGSWKTGQIAGDPEAILNP